MMGQLIQGKWTEDNTLPKDQNGEFIRPTSAFRARIGSETFPLESGRYHLYVSLACPWAHRTLIMRSLKKLESHVGLTVVDPLITEGGWRLIEDPIEHQSFVYQLYTLAQPDYTGRVTVPILWDTHQHTIVNNESSEIICIFNEDFSAISKDGHDYYPEALRSDIDEINDYIYHHINNGVYKAGFAGNQASYDQAVSRLFNALDTLDRKLSTRRYLMGATLTEADIRLYTTLVRFDAVYVGHFKCNLRTIDSYTHLIAYLRDLYQTPGFGETTDMHHIKSHYYVSHRHINPTGLIPKGPILDYDQAHGRDHL